MFAENDDYSDEINLIDLIKLLYEKKSLIIKFTLIVSVLSIIYSLLAPEIYKSEALLAPKSSSQGSLSQMSGSMGGLASLAGLDFSSIGSAEKKSRIAITTLQSKKFFTDYLYEKMLVNLMAVKNWDSEDNQLIIDPKIFNTKDGVWVDSDDNSSGKPSPQKAFKKFKSIFNLYEDQLTGFFTISIEHLSPYVAKSWVDLIVHSINESMRQVDINNSEESLNFLVSKLNTSNQVTMNNVFSNLIEEQTKIRMLANISDDYVFITIDPAIVNELRERPRRTIIVISSTLIAGFIISLYVLIGQYYFVRHGSRHPKS